jgi:hypothetical protein
MTVRIGSENGPAEERITMAALPGEGLIRGPDGSWMSMYAQAAPAYRDAVRGLEPLPASELGLKPRAARGQGRDVDDGGNGVPWVAVAFGAALALGGLAFRALARRRLARPASCR